MKHSVNERSKLGALTGIRAFAATLVVAHHLYPKSADNLPWQILNFLRLGGDVAVTLFFMLSGFVLTYAYLDLDGNSRKQKGEFWNARFSKIYPMYFLALIIISPFVFLLLSQNHSNSLSVLGRMIVYGSTALLLVQAWVPWTAVSYNGPAWSLSAEAFFYFTFPYLGRMFKISEARKYILIGGLWVASFAPNLLYFAYEKVKGVQLPEVASIFVSFTPLFRWPEFVAGMLIGYFYLKSRGNPKVEWCASRYIGVLGAFVAVVALLYSSEQYVNVFVFPACCALIFALAFPAHSVFRPLTWPVFVALGNASYSMYIIHIPLFRLYTFMFSRDLRLRSSSWPDFFVYLCILMIVSLIVYRFIERPAENYLKQRYLRREDKRAIIVA